jgi:cobalt-zinc-cadmium resistance protein CzcA
MFHPMAMTVVLALIGALILSVTFVPAAVALFIGGGVEEKENRVMGWARRGYEPVLKRALANTPVVLAGAGVAVLLSGLVALRLGSEFIPNLNEGDFSVQALRIPGTSLTQSVAMQQQIETRLKATFPEIERIFARTGTAEIASDPMPPNISDAYIMLKPRDKWPDPSRSRDSLRTAIEAELEKIPGNATSSRSRSSCASTS